MQASSDRFIFAFVLLAVLCPHNAHAYIDAGSGSMILQVLLGGIAGALVVIKLYWHKFLSIFKRKS